MVARDAGGNERHALFAIDADGGSELRADGRSGRHPRPGRVLARRLAPRVHAHRPQRRRLRRRRRRRLDGGGRRELAQPGGWSHVADWSEGGILVQRANTPFDHDLFLVDPASGALDAPHAARRRGRLRLGRVCCPTAPCSAPATPAASSRAWRSCAGGAEPEFLTADDADVEIVALDDARTRRAWVVNRGGDERAVARRRARRGPAGRRRLGARVRARTARSTVTAGAARRLDRRLDVPRAVERRTRSAVGGLDRSAFVRPVLDEVESFDGRRIPYLPLRPGGRARRSAGCTAGPSRSSGRSWRR